jgi:acetoin utilization deacetylase AcuC-like enzyme
VEKALEQVKEWKPDLFFWYFGFDTHSGDYGSLGLSNGTYLKIARSCKTAANDACQGKLQVVLAGGAVRDTATRLIPQIIRILAMKNKE